MWIIKAWGHISPEVTVKSFKKCCIFTAMDEADNDMLLNDGNVGSECEEDEGTDCADQDSNTNW
jgi:hypothetical protein